MVFSAPSLALAVTLVAGAAEAAPVTHVALTEAAPAIAVSTTAVSEPQVNPFSRPVVPESTPWMTENGRRPKALPAMYAALGVLQGLDIASTRRAIDAGATEANPLMKSASKNTGAMLAVKALSTAGSIYFTERAWKKNRKGAVVLMAVVNGVTAAVVANNLKNAR